MAAKAIAGQDQRPAGDIFAGPVRAGGTYDHRGPAWKWNNFSMSEHTGTHFDAPSHWISGRDLPGNSVDAIPPENFVGPAVVNDMFATARARRDPAAGGTA